ncbi:hypothetical protein PC116_g23477 [Phytophthora cactorum]|uniref:Uncharacterized protein n=1 Tax=Phytophthora cactorum TaxID=29920 RepID=A0A8T1BPW4_9STRA|nr:hypothetical protein Pcac1_g18945 [Phytophthora cactorum]KAG2882017.1 hypothetical protein PC114_g21240 [Phytophthora cactorum]KAG2904324.1 hypothetical protein PC117_g21063 [Phytophthora cactorum]KAG2982685.1 hypothetical protein PC119_g20783 [Phytophthora cactorum]KAG3001216.1 hypothetical protein PC120_g20400 [Phytophthora cactorum]
MPAHRGLELQAKTDNELLFRDNAMLEEVGTRLPDTTRHAGLDATCVTPSSFVFDSYM